MTIFSNSIEVDINFDNILEDFSVFSIKTSKEYIRYGSYVLDEAITGLKSLSVVFEKGNCFYCIFDDSSLNSNHLAKRLKVLDNAEDLRVEAYKSVSRLETIPKHLLTQLMINTLVAPRHEILRFNNITGHLLHIDPERFVWTKSDKEKIVLKIPALEVRLDKALAIQIDLTTFSSLVLLKRLQLKKPLKDYPKYTISYSTKKLRRVLPSEKLGAEKVFIKKQEPNKKTTVPFLSIESPIAFYYSKIGILYRLYTAIKKQLGRYLKINFVELEPSESIRYNRRSRLVLDQIISTRISALDLNIVDLANDEDSQELADSFKSRMKAVYPENKFARSTQPKAKAINLVVIHNKEYYSKYNLKDPYIRTDKRIVYQHVTIEDFKLDTKGVFENTIKQLCIKQDIHEGKVKIIDWKSFSFNSSWIFACKHEDLFYFLEIDPEGILNFKILENDLFTHSEYSKYCDIYSDFESKKRIGSIEGLIISDQGEINIIRRTNRFTVPEFMMIGETMDNVTKSFTITKEGFLAIYQEFIDLNPSETAKEYYQIFLANDNSMFDRESILKIIKHRTVKKAFNEYFVRKTGHLLHYYFKDEETRYKLLDSNLDIKYFTSDECGYYYVGTKGIGIQSVFSRSSRIREIIPHESSPILFDRLLPLMNVEFVKHEDLTVLPFPFKYLREYIKSSK